MIKAVSAQSIRDVFTACGDMIFCTLFYSMVIHIVFFLNLGHKIGMDHICLFFSPVVMLLTNNIDLLNKSKKESKRWIRCL